ncbi:MAG: hypothetical protein OEM00_10720 [Burkholderiaceae bacterium]|nr:hypothetical protein [Burkholderiaceae bacterium]
MSEHDVIDLVANAPIHRADAATQALRVFEVQPEQVDKMQQTRLIWRRIIALSHLAVWCSPAGGGKTTIAKLAAAEMAASGYNVFFFQEDASAGDLPGLFEHAKKHGYALLNTTLNGATPESQIKVLRELVRSGADLSANVFILDTLKKFADLMSKGGTREFFRLMRGLTQRGGTVLLLAHTNKHKGIDGRWMFEGVGDVRNDVDELIYIEAADKDAMGIVTMTLRPDKWRCLVQPLTFTLDTTTMVLAPSEAVVDVASIEARRKRQEADAVVIEAVRSALAGGGMSFVSLAQEVSSSTGLGLKAAGNVISRWASSQPDEQALWVETRMRHRNVRHISLPPGKN